MLEICNFFSENYMMGSSWGQNFLTGGEFDWANGEGVPGVKRLAGELVITRTCWRYPHWLLLSRNHSPAGPNCIVTMKNKRRSFFVHNTTNWPCVLVKRLTLMHFVWTTNLWQQLPPWLRGLADFSTEISEGRVIEFFNQTDHHHKMSSIRQKNRDELFCYLKIWGGSNFDYSWIFVAKGGHRINLYALLCADATEGTSTRNGLHQKVLSDKTNESRVVEYLLSFAFELILSTTNMDNGSRYSLKMYRDMTLGWWLK